MSRLLERMKCLKPSSFTYIDDKNSGGSWHTYTATITDFKLSLRGWCAWDSNRSSNNPSLCEIEVRYKGKMAEGQTCRVQKCKEELGYIVLHHRAHESLCHKERRDENVFKAYKKVCKSVDRSRAQKKRMKQKRIINKLEETLLDDKNFK